MEGRISRLDHRNGRFSAPPECPQTPETRWSTHSASESFSRRVSVQTGIGASTVHRGASPLRSALKRPGESRTSLASSSSTISGRGSESIYFEPSTSCYSFPNQASSGNYERSSRVDARTAPALRKDVESSVPVDPSSLVLDESPIRKSISNPPRKQTLISALISRLRMGGQPVDSVPTPPTSHAAAPRSQSPLLPRYPCCDLHENTPTVDICNCTPSDSDPDNPPSPNLTSSPTLPVRKTVRFAVWSHMRTFERPDWEPTGGMFEEATYDGSGHRGFLRKVWPFDLLHEIMESLMLQEPLRSIKMAYWIFYYQYLHPVAPAAIHLLRYFRCSQLSRSLNTHWQEYL